MNSIQVRNELKFPLMQAFFAEIWRGLHPEFTNCGKD